MTIDERLANRTQELNDLQQQIEAFDKQIAFLQKQRENAVHLYRRAEGALSELQAIKADEPAAEKDGEA